MIDIWNSNVSYKYEIKVTWISDRISNFYYWKIDKLRAGKNITRLLSQLSNEMSVNGGEWQLSETKKKRKEKNS